MGSPNGGTVTLELLPADAEGATVAVVRFGDPARRNALGLPLLGALRRVAARLADPREGVGAVVLHGNGDDFSSGADLRDVRASSADPRGYVEAVQAAVEAWASIPVPTIAALRGWVLGGGLELAAACDLRVAAPDAKLGLPEMRLGLHPAAGGLARLPRLLGPAWTRRLALSGEHVPAASLVPTGFLQLVDRPGQVLSEAIRLASFLAPRQVAARSAKSVLAASCRGGMERGLALEREGFAACLADGGALRRVDEFLRAGGRP